MAKSIRAMNNRDCWSPWGFVLSQQIWSVESVCRDDNRSSPEIYWCQFTTKTHVQTTFRRISKTLGHLFFNCWPFLKPFVGTCRNKNMILLFPTTISLNTSKQLEHIQMSDYLFLYRLCDMDEEIALLINVTNTLIPVLMKMSN